MLKFLPIAPAPEEEQSQGATTDNAQANKDKSVKIIFIGILVIGAISYLIAKNKK